MSEDAESFRMNLLPSLHPVLRFLFRWTFYGITIVSVPIYSQGFSNLGHQSWSTENGLPQNSVHQIFQSRDGYIWVATEGGVARFDGIDFKVFDHENTPAFTSDDTCCFAQGPNGSLWIGTADGLLQYSQSAFHRYSEADGLPSSGILSIATGEHDLLVLTNSGIASFDGKRFSPVALPSSAIPSAMAPAEDGGIWIASASKIFQYQRGQFRAVPLGPSLLKENIEAIGLLPHHGLWLRTHNNIVLLENGHQRVLQAGRDIPAARLQSVLADSRGVLWIGTNHGLFVLDKAGFPPQLQPALAATSVLSSFEDREGNLWVGTETSGLDILRQQNFHTIPALSDHVITAIAQTSDDAMWAGTNGDGLDRWQHGKVQHFSPAAGLLSDVILSLAPGSHGSLWVGTPDGLNHIEGSRIQTYTAADGLPDDFVRSLLFDSDGSLWIGTRRGLVHWQNGRFIVIQGNGLQSNFIGALLQPHAASSAGGLASDLWIGTLNGLSLLHSGKIITYTTKDGLSGNIITSLAEGQHSTLWIGTKGNGLSYWSNGHFTPLRRHDLPHTIDSILEDDKGNLWLSSTHGITRVSQSSLIACGSSSACNPHPVSYGRSDGMPTEEASAIGHPAAWKTAQGLFWFATRKGVAIVDPGHLSENRIPPPVVIERFTIDGVAQSVSAAEQKIPPGHSSFSFQYSGLSYVAPSKVRYRYILEGFDKQWTDAGSRRIAYYTNLPARHYRFHVQAANKDGVWNETGATIAFYLRPPFYRTPWFLLLAIALIVVIAILLYRLRLRRLHSRFQAVLAERNRMAREIHDTLAQSFVGVSVQLELTAQLLAQSQVSAAGQQIDRTREYVREGLAEARRSIWDLRSLTAQHTLPTRLAQLAEQTSAGHLPIQINIGGTYRPLAIPFENEIFRIAQEALTNVVRHANATNASVDLRYHSDRVTLTVSDNGHGFHTDDSLPERGHFGLQGMRERAAQIRAQLTVKSSPGEGTTITLDAPIILEKVEKGPTNNG
jgi:signal transduction histidine kinase/ligand-binding sensor domain-containing protein